MSNIEDFTADSIKFFDGEVNNLVTKIINGQIVPGNTVFGPTLVVNETTYKWKLVLVADLGLSKLSNAESTTLDPITENTTEDKLPPVVNYKTSQDSHVIPVKDIGEKDEGWDSIDKMLNEPEFDPKNYTQE